MSDPKPDARERWRRASDLFHRALAEDVSARPAFLNGACGDDAALRAEVASLLDAHEGAGDFIESPAGRAADLVDRSPLGAVGGLFGPYRLVRELGRGGMGVVYLAEDTRLGRTVALKAVAPEFAADPTRRERLRREARALALVNHPGIAAVYSLEEIDGMLVIASEYVAGETLREELAHGPLGPARALDAGLAVARALAAAHVHGLVHRDLKPENVMRAVNGDLKLLDFGLVRFSDATTTMTELTGGHVLGTPAYMSPEQIRGEAVDGRSDLFALGALLYELATGVHPFRGSDSAATIARIIEREPPRLADHLPAGHPGASARFEEVIAGCLHKSPGARFQTSAQLVAALERAREVAGPAARQPRPADESVPLERTPRAFRWWQFHQAAAALAYALLLIPIWQGRTVAVDANSSWLFTPALVAAVVAATLRLHFLFAAREYPAEWRAQHARATRWIRLADVGFVAILAIEGTLALSGAPALGMLLVASAAVVFVSFAVIEPATTRAGIRL